MLTRLNDELAIDLDDIIAINYYEVKGKFAPDQYHESGWPSDLFDTYPTTEKMGSLNISMSGNKTRFSRRFSIEQCEIAFKKFTALAFRNLLIAGTTCIDIDAIKLISNHKGSINLHLSNDFVYGATSKDRTEEEDSKIVNDIIFIQQEKLTKHVRKNFDERMIFYVQ